MPRTLPTLAAALLLLGALAPLPARSAPTPPLPDTVRVAPPTGSVEGDPARVQEAFDRVQPGDTVLFRAGTYRMGPGARLTVPDVTVLGHPDGTVLRGCEPERFDLAPGFTMDDVGELVFGCTGLFVLADRQTIRGLTFDHTWHGLAIGHLPTGPEEGPAPRGFGGHRIEGNIFRNVPNGIRVVGPTDAVTVIRDNQVLNAFHAFQSNGAPLHVLDNRISVPDPHSVPAAHHPESGVILGGGPPPSSCRGSLVAGNVIEGTLHGIQVLAAPGEPCADHEIRGNVVRLGPVRLPVDYPDHLRAFYFGEGVEGETAAGIGIRLDGSGFSSARPEEPTIRNVVVRDNRILGASGLGIQVRASTRVHIVDNHVSGIRRRGFDPEVRLSGPLAMVWLPYDFHTDGAWSHCGVDVFTLFRTGEGWRIAGILYSYEQPPACRRHPDGPPAG